MSLSTPRTLFGIHNFTAVNRSTGVPYGVLKVLTEGTVTGTREAIDLRGGSNPNIIASEHGDVTVDCKITFKEAAPFLFDLAGYTRTTGTTEASGNVGTLTNKYGTSVQNATTGIASSVVIPTTGAANLKDGIYVIKAASSTTVNVYEITDIMNTDGSDVTIQDDTLKVNPSPLAITSGSNTDITELGLRLSGGSGTIGMTIGDTATVEVRSANVGYNSYAYGENPVPIEFGAYLFSQKKSNGEFGRIYLPKVKFGSVPLSMRMKDWLESSIDLKVMYDTTAQASIIFLDIKKEA